MQGEQPRLGEVVNEQDEWGQGKMKSSLRRRCMGEQRRLLADEGKTNLRIALQPFGRVLFQDVIDLLVPVQEGEGDCYCTWSGTINST